MSVAELDVFGLRAGSARSAELRRQHIQAVIKAVMACEEIDDPRWHSLALVFSFTKGGQNFGNGGYAYGDGPAWWAIGLPVLKVKRAVVEFVSDVRPDMPQGLCRVLLQYDRKLDRARLTPVFDDPDYWAITPENARDMAEVLRPKFADREIEPAR